jgi:hypothetical protein
MLHVQCSWYKYRIHEFKISTTWIHNFNFINSRFQLHAISASWINDFNFTNSRFQPRIHYFNFTNSRFHLHDFTTSTSWICFGLKDFNLTDSRLHLEVEIVNVNLWSWILEVENREFFKLKSWILEIMNSWIRMLKTWIHEVEIVNSWKWTFEFKKLKCYHRLFPHFLSTFMR